LDIPLLFFLCGLCVLCGELMLLKRLHSAAPREVVLNVTPFVDILFLLIIFFILASRFVAPESFDVRIPDGVGQAQNVTSAEGIATITLMRLPSGLIECALGSEKLPRDGDKVVNSELLAEGLDRRLELLPPERRAVALRIDRHVPYRDAQHILAAVAKSSATSVRLAAIKDKQM
jgi:biopolymer transport protein ExbD